MSTIETELSLLERVASYDLSLEARTPSYCAGCPHRGTSSVILDLRAKLNDAAYMRREHDREPVDIIAHGGIGCYSLNFLPPFRDMHNMAAMGLGGAAGMGAYAFTTNKHYVLCGDSTFFHSEMSTLSNAIKDTQDILYIILDNKNTAMTGHQTTPASAYDVMGYKTIQQDIESVVRGMDNKGQVFVRRVNPVDRDSYLALLEDAFLMDGVRVIIADRECGITWHRRRRSAERETVRREGFLRKETHINISPEVCENCRECTLATGCPGLTIVPTPYGEKIGIDGSICVDDRYCTKIKACPSFEQVEITRSKARPARTGDWGLWMRDLPHPVLPSLHPVTRPVFSIFVPGVGGMGLGFVARILTETGAREGYTVNFYHQKGLAQRNGAVVSHVIYSLEGTPVSQRIPEGKADLILGLDFLETVRGLSLASAPRTGVVCNTARTPTVLMLMGENRFPEGIEERILRCSDRDRYMGADFFRLSEHYFDNRLYANSMMLGSAYQLGLLPAHADTVEAVIRESVGKDERENNLRAFRLGRRLVTHPDMLLSGAAGQSLATLLTDKAALLRRARPRFADIFERRMTEERATMPLLPEQFVRDLARRYADLLIYENADYADTFVSVVRAAYGREATLPHDDAPRFEATGAVIWNLYKVMAIKDEIWVAWLLTSDEKLRADRDRYGIDPSRGDRVRYLHINRPHFDVFGRSIEWDMATRNWMLHIVKHLRWLRRLLPRWHARERAFRDWYRVDVVGAWLRGAFTDETDALEALQLPMTCTGYRDVVYPKHENARNRVAALLERASRLRAT